MKQSTNPSGKIYGLGQGKYSKNFCRNLLPILFCHNCSKNTDMGGLGVLALYLLLLFRFCYRFAQRSQFTIWKIGSDQFKVFRK
jgi:hypothetical protein